jgi:hypothetical protein
VRQACKGVPGDPANCIFDLKVTGLTNIAHTFFLAASPVEARAFLKLVVHGDVLRRLDSE